MRKIRKKKGQITMESLLLYGAAFLVVLLAIAALTYFGILDLGRYLPEKCNFEGTGIFKCDEWKADASTGAISIVVTNKGSKSVDITAATFTATDTGLANGCAATITSAITVTPGAQIANPIVITCAHWNAEKGNRIGGEITLTHTFTGGQLSTDTVGDLVITVS